MARLLKINLLLNFLFIPRGTMAFGISSQEIISSSSTTTRLTELFAAKPKPKEGVFAITENLNLENITDRRKFVASSSSIAILGLAALGINPSSALAKYGDSASIKAPGIGSYIDFLIEKNEQQQEPDAALASYRGADMTTQLRRLSEAANRLTDIEELAENKKWSQVQGIISGPLGTLLQTMNTVVSANGGDGTNKGKKVKEASAAVKGDIIAIGQAATRKNAEGCIQAADKAMGDLKIFVEVAYE